MGLPVFICYLVFVCLKLGMLGILRLFYVCYISFFTLLGRYFEIFQCFY